MSLPRLATSALLFALIPAFAQAPSPPAPPEPATPPSTATEQPAAQHGLPGLVMPEPGPPTIRVRAQEVVVDIRVTDDSGKAFYGLQQSDFTVEENGKAQTIRSFYESAASAEPAHIKPVPLPVGEYTNSRPLSAAGGPINIFLVDHVNGGAPFSDSVIRSLPIGAPAGIFAITASGLHTVQDITTDHNLLVRAIHAPVGGAIQDDWPRKMTTLHAFNQLAAYLSGIPGPKNLFWGVSSSGPPLLLMRDGGYSWGMDARSADMSLVHHTMDTYEMLTAARVALYPVAYIPFSLGWGALETQKIAEDFGTAVVYFTRDDLAPKLAAAVEQASHYYSLSYIPPRRSLDGHFHTITVTIDKPGLTLTYRKGYDSERTPTLEDPAPGPELMKAALEGNFLNATQILFDAAIRPVPPAAPAPSDQSSPGKAKPVKGAKNKATAYSYQIAYGLPASQFSFAEDEYGKLNGAVEFDVIAYDSNRTRVAQLSQIVHMPLAWDQFDDFAASTFRFTQQIDLPPGLFWIHVGILDTVSNRVGTLEFPLMVGTSSNAGGTRLGFGPPRNPMPPDNPLPCPMPCTNGPYTPNHIP